VVLAVTAGLLTRSFLALTSSELGYRPERLLVMYAHAPAHGDEEYVRAAQALNDVLPMLAAAPSVRSASAVMGLPAGRYSSHGAYAVEGLHRFAPGQNLPVAGFRLAAPGYFATMGMRVLRGRDFAATDTFDAPRVAIISAALARESFGGSDPIGRRIQCGLDSLDPMTIVGVVSDVRHESPSAPLASELYMPLLQHPSRANEVQFVLRTAAEPETAVGAVRAVMTRQVPGVALRFTTMNAELAGTMAAPRFRMALVAAFAGLALVLAAVGVFGLMNYVAVQRTSELGLRAALGAAPADLLVLLLQKSVVLAAAGILSGAVAAALVARLLESMLFGVAAHDPATYAAVVASVAAATLLASAIPAIRASRVDPLLAIRDGES
jgi:predicted permease